MNHNTQTDRAYKLASQGKLDQAIELLEGMLECGLSIHPKYLGQACELLGRCHMGLGNITTALHAVNTAADYFEQAGMERDMHYTKLLYISGSIGFGKRLINDNVKSYLKEALELADRNNWDDLNCISHYLKAVLLWSEHHVEEAVEALDRSLKIHDPRMLPWEICYSLLMKGDCLVKLGDSERGGAALKEAYAALAKIPSSLPRISIHFYIANLSFVIRDFKWVAKIMCCAIKELDKEKPLNRRDKVKKCGAFYNWGLAQLHLGELEEAGEHLKSAHKIAKAENNLYLTNHCAYALGIYALLAGKPRKAVKYAMSVLEKTEDFPHQKAKLAIYLLAFAFLLNGETEKAIEQWGRRTDLPCEVDCELELTLLLRIADSIATRRETPEKDRLLASEWHGTVEEMLGRIRKKFAERAELLGRDGVV